MEKYFTEEDGKVILQTIRNTLSVLNSQDISDEAKLETSDIQLKKSVDNVVFFILETLIRRFIILIIVQ